MTIQKTDITPRRKAKPNGAAAEQRTPPVPEPPADIAAQLAEEEDHDRGEREEPLGAIASAWRPLDLAMFTEPPPARRWLLRHPTRDGKECAPGAGDGMFPLGKVGLFVADGGVGKTMALLGLGVSIITGRPWLDHFAIGREARPGRVLLALAEEDLEEVRRRLFTITQALKLDEREHARIVDRLVVLPLSGKVVSLLSYAPEGRTLIESPELTSLREHLRSRAGEDGWSLVVLDPLARWGADDTEKDNAIATRTMQAAETLVEVPGRPAVLLAHHTSEAGARFGTIRARGATGLRDGARWESTLREDGTDVYFRQTKSNYSRPMREDLRLVRGEGGLLRVASAAEEQERQQRAAERVVEKQNAKATVKEDAREARIVAFMEPLVEALRAAQAPVTSQKQLVALIKGDTNIKQEAAARLLTGPPARIVSVGEGKDRHYEVSMASG